MGEKFARESILFRYKALTKFDLLKRNAPENRCWLCHVCSKKSSIFQLSSHCVYLPHVYICALKQPQIDWQVRGNYQRLNCVVCVSFGVNSRFCDRYIQKKAFESAHQQSVASAELAYQPIYMKAKLGEKALLDVGASRTIRSLLHCQSPFEKRARLFFSFHMFGSLELETGYDSAL